MSISDIFISLAFVFVLVLGVTVTYLNVTNTLDRQYGKDEDDQTTNE